MAIVAGVRTPFAKSGTTLKNLTAIELGKHCVAELIQRTEISGKLVEMTAVEQTLEQLAHVVRLAVIFRNDLVEFFGTAKRLTR